MWKAQLFLLDLTSFLGYLLINDWLVDNLLIITDFLFQIFIYYFQQIIINETAGQLSGSIGIQNEWGYILQLINQLLN